MEPDASVSAEVALVEGGEAAEITAAVLAGLAQYNLDKAGVRETRPLVLSLRSESGNVIGGLVAKTFWNALQIELLWVDETGRAQGCGRNLVRAAEAEARRRGAEVACVNTISFQAPGFYERLGYRQFAKLEDVPRGASRLWYSKRLVDDA